MLIRSLVVTAVIVLGVGVWAWWHFTYSNPKRVFWQMVDNALQTNGFTKEIVQHGQAQNLDQKTLAILQPKQIASGKNEIKQAGAGGFDVVTDILGTPKADYIRYSSIKTDQKNAQGKPMDYSSITGVWGKTDAGAGTTNGQLYSQMVLAAVPFGDLAKQQRKELEDIMRTKSVYVTDYSTATRRIRNGRPVYSYDVSVNAEAYIIMLKKYASFVGLSNLDQTNPADYNNTRPIKFQFEVDVWTRGISVIRYGNGREEHYSGFGIHPPKTGVPSKSISTEELQQRIQTLR